MTIWPVCTMNIALEDTMNKNLIFCVRLVVSVRMCVLRTATASSTSVWVGGAFPRNDHLRTQVVFGVARENWTHPFNLIWALNINLLIHQMLGKSIAFLFRKQKLYKDSHFITVQNSSILFIYDHMCIWNHVSHYLHSCT